MTHLWKTIAARHEERENRRLLQKGLAAFAGPADRLEIAAIAYRRSDDEAHEIRSNLAAAGCLRCDRRPPVIDGRR